MRVEVLRRAHQFGWDRKCHPMNATTKRIRAFWRLLMTQIKILSPRLDDAQGRMAWKKWRRRNGVGDGVESQSVTKRALLNHSHERWRYDDMPSNTIIGIRQSYTVSHISILGQG